MLILLLILLILPLTLAKSNEKQNTFSNSNLKNNLGIIILCIVKAIFYSQKCNGHINPHWIHSIVFLLWLNINTIFSARKAYNCDDANLVGEFSLRDIESCPDLAVQDISRKKKVITYINVE